MDNMAPHSRSVSEGTPEWSPPFVWSAPDPVLVFAELPSISHFAFLLILHKDILYLQMQTPKHNGDAERDNDQQRFYPEPPHVQFLIDGERYMFPDHHQVLHL